MKQSDPVPSNGNEPDKGDATHEAPPVAPPADAEGLYDVMESQDDDAGET